MPYSSASLTPAVMVKLRELAEEDAWFTLTDFKAMSGAPDSLKKIKDALERELGTLCIEQKKIGGSKYRSVFWGDRLV